VKPKLDASWPDLSHQLVIQTIVWKIVNRLDPGELLRFNSVVTQSKIVANGFGGHDGDLPFELPLQCLSF
jgi:hypothetical protein